MASDQQAVPRRDRETLWDLLQVLAGSNGLWRNEPLTAFAALGEYGDPRELMVIGRAVNGWRKQGWGADDHKDP